MYFVIEKEKTKNMKYIIEENRLLFNLAGFSKEEIEIEQQDQFLTISSVKELKTGNFKDHFHLQFRLPTSKKVEASLKEGILEIKLPEKQKTKIEIKSP